MCITSKTKISSRIFRNVCSHFWQGRTGNVQTIDGVGTTFSWKMHGKKMLYPPHLVPCRSSSCYVKDQRLTTSLSTYCLASQLCHLESHLFCSFVAISKAQEASSKLDRTTSDRPRIYVNYLLVVWYCTYSITRRIICIIRIQKFNTRSKAQILTLNVSKTLSQTLMFRTSLSLTRTWQKLLHFTVRVNSFSFPGLEVDVESLPKSQQSSTESSSESLSHFWW